MSPILILSIIFLFFFILAFSIPFVWMNSKEDDPYIENFIPKGGNINDFLLKLNPEVEAKGLLVSLNKKILIEPLQYKEITSRISLGLPENTFGIFSVLLNCQNIVIIDALIPLENDSYITIRIFNTSEDQSFIIEKNQDIAQLVILPQINVN